MRYSAATDIGGALAQDAPDQQMRQLLVSNGLAVQSLRPARSGREHHLFHVVLIDGSVWMAKFPRADWHDPHWPDRDPMRALAAEAEAIRLLRARDESFPLVPHPYHLLPGDPPGAIMGVVPGNPPEQALFKHGMEVRTLRAVCLEMGRMLASIHRVRRPDRPGLIPDLPGADPAQARLLHMDFHLGNVLGHLQLGQGFRLVGVVDWTCARWGPREADLAEMGASLFATNPELLDDFLLGYRQASGIVLSMPRVLDVLVGELERRLRDDPPEEPRIRNLFVARVEEWSRQV